MQIDKKYFMVDWKVNQMEIKLFTQNTLLFEIVRIISISFAYGLNRQFVFAKFVNY